MIKINKKIIISFIVLLLVVLAVVLISKNKNNKGDEVNRLYELKQVEDESANIESILIYGTHLNIIGNISNITGCSVEKASITLINSLDEESEYLLEFEVNEGEFKFKTSEYINDGIYLENILSEDYIILLKLFLSDKSVKYYTFSKENFENMEYYTVSNNGKCNLLKFKYDDTKKCISLNVKNVGIPENVYDVTIDAGHGGSDPGAVYNGYSESDFTLDYAISLKEALEKIGLKVKLTRNDDIRGEEYGKNGRAVIPNEVKSKYTFSIHLNSSEKKEYNGVEVYAASKLDLSFAKTLAKNIVTYANTNYSQNENYKIEDGIYVRCFSENDIKEASDYAKRVGYSPYNLTVYTPYLFMIRETGGKSTNAYMDGRNKNYGENMYYDSNIGNESYLLELGFINSDKDLENILNNKEGYIQGIVESVVQLLKKN